ncbi:MAG: GNAT family N-acetyltransferase [Betaproteobacteria bacterium]
MVRTWNGDAATLEGPRSLTADELPDAVALSTGIFSPGGTSMGMQFPLLFSPENAGNLRVFSECGRIVSLVGCLRQTIWVDGHPLPVGSVGSVCTKPEHRGRGLAGRLVYDVFAQLEAVGIPLALISGDRGLYKQLGCVEAGCFERFEVAREDWAQAARRSEGSRARGNGVWFRLFQEGDLALLHNLYQGEPVRFGRTLEEFDRLIWRCPGLKRLFGDERVVVSYRGRLDQVSAYVITRLRTAQDGSSKLHIVEYAGDREDVIDAISYAVRQDSPSVITLTIPAWDTNSLRLLNAGGLWGLRSTLPGHTLYVTSVRALMEKLSSYIKERLGTHPGTDGFTLRESGDPESGLARWILGVGGEEVEIPSRQHLTRLIFGGLSTEELQRIAPHERPRRVLATVFPVPLPVPGLNYV